MKKTFIIFIVVILALTVFMGSALADKPADKPNKGNEQGEDEQGEEPEDGEEGPKKPNEKRDAKKLFKVETRPLIDEIHANREEWGALGEAQGDLGDAIDAQIDAMVAGGAELTAEQIAIIKAKIAQIKALKVTMRDMKGNIHGLWKQYIAAKKDSDVAAATLALNALIAQQELRIGVRGDIVDVMNELAAALGIVVEPSVPEVAEVPAA